MADDPPFVAISGHERKTAQRKAKPDVRARRCHGGGIEIEAEGVTMRLRRRRGDDCAIVHALKASR
ncbi:hypothetical protein [Bradyrhizobium yuanmingense]|uniref:hypothetical protein n=1 Tax=Bradyrhizobium yuanmingense TaxID=108015 RepID=UPI0023B99965|nr:hypothetical protein [Bradyrhizobium yuanmingense]MDF0493090.1 hypothetical protein [Bradyrhizobium yuanmingense]